MKRLTIYLLLSIGFCLSQVIAQKPFNDKKHDDFAVFVKPAGENPKPVKVILEDFQEKIGDLSQQLQKAEENSLEYKALMIESMLYRGMMSNLTTTSKTLASAYESSMAVFLIDYPESDDYAAKKQDIVLDFYNLIFNN